MKVKGDIKGQVALITGGTQGIGLSVARKCHSLGMKVAVCARSIEVLTTELADLFIPIACDVRQESEVSVAVDTVFEKLGRIDVLINAAGVSMPEPISVENIPAEMWDTIMETNARGTFLFCKAVLSRMKKKGYGIIINILSTGAYRATPGNAPYSASKFAARALTEALIEETRDTGIRVSSISPGPVATNIWSHKSRIVSDEEKRRMLKPGDIANIVAFLCLQPDYVHIDNITVTPKFPKS